MNSVNLIFAHDSIKFNVKLISISYAHLNFVNLVCMLTHRTARLVARYGVAQSDCRRRGVNVITIEFMLPWLLYIVTALY